MFDLICQFSKFHFSLLIVVSTRIGMFDELVHYVFIFCFVLLFVIVIIEIEVTLSIINILFSISVFGVRMVLE